MSEILKAIPSKGRLNFYNSYDLERFCLQYEGVEMIVEIKQAAKTGEKMLLYAYYHSGVLEAAVRGYAHIGYAGVDKVKADYLLRAELAKDFILKPSGEYVPIMLDKHKMSKERLLKFVQDCIFFIETELQQEVIDAAEYKAWKATGRKFRKT